jgi:transglutaminase-like putative cysteine protease
VSAAKGTTRTTRAGAGAPPRASLGRLLAQLPRDKADTLLLLAAALMVLAPHAAHLPLWVSALCGLTLLWRAVATLRGTRMPSALLLLPLSLAAMAGVFMSYSTLFGRDAGVAMLVLLVAFKMLEMHARRDLFVVIFLSFFLVLTNFFYSQSIFTALVMIASIIALLTAQLSFQFTGVVPPLGRRLRMGARVFLLAAPLAVLLFFLFPRIQGPLWGMPSDAQGARMGLSNSMSPGNMSNLAQSNDPVFQVRFIDPVPAKQQLYWRGVVLGDFDGRTWTKVRRSRQRAAEQIGITAHGPAIRYELTLEPSSNNWLFTLDLPDRLPLVDGNPVRVSPELEMSTGEPIGKRVRYAMSSHIDYSLDDRPELPERARWLALPAGFNPKAVETGAQLAQSIGNPDGVVSEVLGMFNRQPFSYTLQPPLLGRDTVDDFLFRSRAGFCEHYASAFVVLMRAAGVPARVVTGYQGGELNPVDGFVAVTQSEAHAWAEVWIAGRGWIRVDPTAAVAPERVQRGLSSALAKNKSPVSGLGALFEFSGQPSALLDQLRFRLDAINTGWNQWVLNYTPERQSGFLDELQRSLAHWRSAAILGAIAALALLLRAVRQRRGTDPVDALYSALCRRMSQLGMARAADEGPNAYAARLAQGTLAPDKIVAAGRFLALYSAHKYSARPPAPGLASTLKSLLNNI